jgi:hypothetical protein
MISAECALVVFVWLPVLAGAAVIGVFLWIHSCWGPNGFRMGDGPYIREFGLTASGRRYLYIRTGWWRTVELADLERDPRTGQWRPVLPEKDPRLESYLVRWLAAREAHEKGA